MNLVDCIAEYDNILSDEMCDVMIDWFNANEELQDDGAIGTIEGEGVVNNKIKKSRQSYPHPEDSISDLMTEVIKKTYREYKKDHFVPEDSSMIAVRDYSIRVYDKNDGHFLRHMDQAGVASRLFAIIMYLNTVDQGGETEFPDHNVKVKPEKGKVLIFPCNFMFYHQGNTPISGDKWIATAFINLIIPKATNIPKREPVKISY
tara:strand:+ start:46 stop:657 length:612 start_codon:yes stop_codon:yes gene_type:complete